MQKRGQIWQEKFTRQATHGPVKLGSLDIVMSHVDYKYWIAGHYHRNAELHLKDKGRGKEMILYEQIVWIQ